MRKGGLVLLFVGGCFVLNLAAQQTAPSAKPPAPPAGAPIATAQPPVPPPPQDERTAKMRQMLEISKKMYNIETQASAKDEELAKYDAEFAGLKKQYQDLVAKRRQRLNVVLTDNKEYQELKQKLDALRPPPPQPPAAAAPKDDKKTAPTTMTTAAPAAPTATATASETPVKADKSKKKKK